MLLNDTELDIARLVADAIVRRFIEDGPHLSSLYNRPRWKEYLDLQDNELLHVQTQPYIVDSHLRVYQFLRSALPTTLQPYLVSSETVRETLARVSGNAMGIWQLSPTRDDGEMFGWGVYVSGAYFNHSVCNFGCAPVSSFPRIAGCTPNVRKIRVGRAMKFYAMRDIQYGEELCISYVTLEDGVEERRRTLQENWYFHCECNRCHAESSVSVSIMSIISSP
jgi:hypothetical protein